MENVILYSVILLIVGIFITILGAITIKYKLSYIIRWVNLNKYDKNTVAEIAGSHLLVYGMLLVVLGVLNYILKGYYLNIIVIISVFCGIAMEYGGYRKIIKYSKKK